MPAGIKQGGPARALLGLVSLGTSSSVVQAALSALAVELVKNRWSDQMQVTLVGFGDGLAEISPERVRLIRALDEAPPTRPYGRRTT